MKISIKTRMYTNCKNCGTGRWHSVLYRSFKTVVTGKEKNILGVDRTCDTCDTMIGWSEQIENPDTDS